MATMQREIIRWLSSLDLTQPVRNPQMDLANGFLFAEIISRYDRRVSMHRYSPGCSSECKRRNWKALLDDMKSTGLARTAPDIAEAVIQGKPGAALKILDQLYEYFSGRPAPPRHETVGRAAAALLEVMEVAQGTVEQRGVDSTNCAESLLPAINSEFPLVHVLRQPGFAQPTTTALLRVANSDSRSAKLIGPTPQDELKVVKRNEKLMAEHDMLNKLHRQTNPQRFAHAKRPGIHNVGNKQRKNPMNRAARWDDYHLNVGRASTVHIRSLNDRIISGLRDRAADDGYKNIVEGSVDIDPIEGQMITIFEEANSDLRVSLSRLMGTLLNSVKHAKVWERVYGCSENEDLFSAFVGHCGNMPFSTLTECWGLLMRASGHVAGVLFARPSEFVYLLRALRFIFSPEVLHIRMLHVSSTLRDPVAAEDSSSTNCTVRFDVAGHSVSRGIGSAESGELHYRKQRGVAQGVQALNVASAYRFLCSIGTAVHSLSPPLAFSLLSNYFIPSISKVLPMTSTVIMDAISRVVVSFIYGAIDETNDSKAAETDRRGTLKEELEDGLDQGEKWNPTEQLIALLTGLLKENFMHGGVPESPNYVWWRAQYSLLVRHLLHNGRGDVMLCKQLRTDATSECKSSEDTSDISICTMDDLCTKRVFIALASHSLQERTVGVAMLLELFSWDRWDLAIEPLLMIIGDIKKQKEASVFLIGATGSWETRVLLLDLFTAAFRSALFFLAGELRPACDSETKPLEGLLSQEITTRIASIIRERLDFDDLEVVTEVCLALFLNAPLLQRQLALQVVGKRLLPEKQRSVAATWIRCIISFPADRLDFLLRSPEASTQLYMHTSTDSRHFMPSIASSSRRASSVSILRPEVDEHPLQRLSSVQTLPHDEWFPDELCASNRLLVGRVKPTYVVAPLSESWDTFGAVQAALMFEGALTTVQLFSIIVSAFSASQKREMEPLSLLHGLLGASVGHSAMPPLDQVEPRDAMILCGSVSNILESTVHTDDECTPVSLRSLVKPLQRSTDVERKETKETEEEVADNTLTESDNAEGVTLTTVSTEMKDENFSTLLWPSSEDVDPTKQMDGYVEAFWLSVLHLLKHQLQECLADDRVEQEHFSVHQLQKRKKKRANEKYISSWKFCRISSVEELGNARKLAASILLSFYSRYEDKFPFVGMLRRASVESFNHTRR